MRDSTHKLGGAINAIPSRPSQAFKRSMLEYLITTCWNGPSMHTALLPPTSWHPLACGINSIPNSFAHHSCHQLPICHHNGWPVDAAAVFFDNTVPGKLDQMISTRPFVRYPWLLSNARYEYRDAKQITRQLRCVHSASVCCTVKPATTTPLAETARCDQSHRYNDLLNRNHNCRAESIEMTLDFNTLLGHGVCLFII